MEHKRSIEQTDREQTPLMKHYESPSLDQLGSIPDASRDDLYDISVIVG
ncbi:MAG: hypothetical protein WHT81_08275 [Rectinemataceae bacterium]|nr:hypothetical protein [Spirochaetaceae bacterium]